MPSRSALTRSSYGLDRDENGWWTRALCAGPGHDPDDWIVGHGGPSQANLEALLLCQTQCPVQRECRDAALAGTAPRGAIVGGLHWDASGRHRDPNAKRRAGNPAGTNTPVVPRSALFDAAGRVVRREERPAAAGERLGVSTTVLSVAAQIVRHAPHLVQQVVDGEISLDEACRQARAAKAGQA